MQSYKPAAGGVWIAIRKARGETMNTAQVLVELLKEYEVEHIFGVPGDTTMPLYDALYDARSEIRHIMARDERSAAFMADAYARLAHKPGITEAPSGGGATYVIPGVAEANGSSVPMVVFTSDVPITDEGKGTLTAIDQQRLLQAATKWSAGVIGGNGGRPYANQLLAEADCIFYLGTKVNSLVTLNGTIPAPGQSVKVLQIDTDPNELGNNVPTASAACGDLKESLAALLGIASSRNITAPSRQWSVQTLAQRAAAYWVEVAERSACNDMPIAPQRVIDALWQHTPSDVVLVADPGTMTPFTAAQFRTRRPGRSILIPRAHGGLGYALPSTVGAAFARPQERVVGLVGDGSFGMSGTELATIASLRLPITIILFNNGRFGWVKTCHH